MWFYVFIKKDFWRVPVIIYRGTYSFQAGNTVLFKIYMLLDIKCTARKAKIDMVFYLEFISYNILKDSPCFSSLKLQGVS